MSVALHVRLKHPLALDQIKSASSAALRDLLRLNYEPEVGVRLDASDRVGDDLVPLLADGSNRVICSLPANGEQVTLTPFRIPVQTPTKDGSYLFIEQIYVSVSWHFKKTPLCWALVAAVALGVAEKERSQIEDNSGFFTESDTQQPDEFRRSVKLKLPYADLETAAEAFLAKLPKSAAVSDWLRALEPPTGAPFP